MTDAQSRPIPRGSRRPEFQALASGPHRLAAANRGLVRQVKRHSRSRKCLAKGHSWILSEGTKESERHARPHKVCQRCGKFRRLTNLEAAMHSLSGRGQKSPVATRIEDWWQSRSKNKDDKQLAAEADGERGGV